MEKYEKVLEKSTKDHPPKFVDQELEHGKSQPFSYYFSFFLACMLSLQLSEAKINHALL